MAVEKIRLSAGLTISWSALAMAERELPPRSTITWSGVKLDCGTKASGTPSPLVSTALAVRGSGRWMSLLKNCVWEPRSYLRPRFSTSVRSTKMIFAWIDTCGVRMSRPRTNSSTRLTRLEISVSTSALLVVSVTTAPRFVRMDCTDGTSALALA